MTAFRLSQILTAATLGLLVLQVPTPVAAQGCSAHTCTVVNRVQVTVPQRLGLNTAGAAASGVAAATVHANTAWRLQVNAVPASATIAAASGSDRSSSAAIRDNPNTATVAVRYTLVGS